MCVTSMCAAGMCDASTRVTSMCAASMCGAILCCLLTGDMTHRRMNGQQCAPPPQCASRKHVAHRLRDPALTAPHRGSGLERGTSGIVPLGNGRHTCGADGQYLRHNNDTKKDTQTTREERIRSVIFLDECAFLHTYLSRSTMGVPGHTYASRKATYCEASHVLAQMEPTPAHGHTQQAYEYECTPHLCQFILS